MKKLLIFSIIGMWIGLWIGCTLAFAAPFLVCDPDTSTDTYIITWEDGSKTETPAPLHYDLKDIEVGKYPIQVNGKNIWGEGPAVPFSFTKEYPQSVTNLVLSPD